MDVTTQDIRRWPRTQDNGIALCDWPCLFMVHIRLKLAGLSSHLSRAGPAITEAMYINPFGCVLGDLSARPRMLCFGAAPGASLRPLSCTENGRTAGAHIDVDRAACMI